MLIKLLEWISTDEDGSTTITLSNYEGRKVVEVEYENELDRIGARWRASRDRKERKELKESYRNVAKELNGRYKKPIFSEELS